MPQRKELNLVSVVKYRQKMRDQMGESAYKAKMAEAKRLQREKAKIKKADEIQNKKLVMASVTSNVNAKSIATLKGSNLVADVFSSILNAIPNERPKTKRGRKIIYKPNENMTDKEKRKLATKEKKREYMREYMRGVYAKKKALKTNA